MAKTETFVHGRLYQMPLADLQPDPNQPRKYIDPAALEEDRGDHALLRVRSYAIR